MIPLFTADEQPTMAEFNERITQANADIQAAIQEAIASGLQIVTGTYTGTGTSGASNAQSLSFQFVPLFVAIVGQLEDKYINNPDKRRMTPFFGSSYSESGIFTMYPAMLSESAWTYMGGFGRSYSYDDYADGPFGKISNGGKTVSWYSAGISLNQAGFTYHYFAIGQGGAT